MPVLQSDTVVSAIGSPLKKSRLSLKFFQKKETKRALDFSESQVEEQTPFEPDKSCDQVVPAPPPPSPTCERKDNVVPFVGLNNLGNTCYLNSILQVLYYCPGFKDAIKKLYSVLSSKEKRKDDSAKKQEGSEEVVPMNMELLESFHSLIISMEQLQSSFLLNCKQYNDGELATPPRRLLNTLRNLNPMYEGYLQHDAQEVLRCILGYIQEACESIKKEFKSDVQLDITEGKYEREEYTDSSDASSGTTKAALKNSEDDKDSLEGQVTGKRKSDTEAGNDKKRSKPLKTKKPDESKHFTRSKRKSSSDVGVESGKDENKGGSDPEESNHDVSKVPTKSQKRPRLSWLKPSGKQPSIFSKFRSMGRISSQIGGKEDRAEQEKGGLLPSGKDEDARETDSKNKLLLKSEEKKEQNEGNYSFDLMERMFQGQLVLRTRCLECECFTERREDFQDISVPVQEDEPCQDDQNSEISPDPKPELKTLKWAISQFASVERIVGEDKYFCETCHHYTEAERSLLFDKTPEVVTIHLKCFAANSSEIDPYAGLSKVNTPLQTPLRLSLDEWCTWPSKEHYELFAVVMHSGVTISSGHYTTYVKMMDLKDVKVELAEESFTSEPLNEKAKTYGPRDYDDGEVSFSLSGKVQTSTTGSLAAKKASEGVGLLGGQRSVCSIELAGNKQANSDKAAGAATERAKARPINSSNGHQSIVKNEECGEPLVTACEDGDKVSVGVESAQRNLLDYEGKWMLFDDSEVRLFEEKDFLKACSPETCTTSTPYLLFYKKVQV